VTESRALGRVEVRSPRASASIPAVAFDGVTLSFEDNVVLRDISFSVPQGQMMVVLGASGSGKSVLLKLILGLLRPDTGHIWIDGQRIDDLTESKLMGVRANIGMLFQESALFDSLTVAENVGYRLYEETDMPLGDVRRRVEEVRGLVGLRNTSIACPRSCREVSAAASPWRGLSPRNHASY
jgi:phospholipid/cholesterol/gamma-HCH transport system ATP-binding protein